MKETLQVKNFGPITEAYIEIKNINIFIGTTSSGKSTLAKLIAIFKDGNLFYETNSDAESKENSPYKSFEKLLANANIEFKVSLNTLIRYEIGDQFVEFRHSYIVSNFSRYSSASLNTAIYIPAERVFFPTFSQSIFSLLSNDIALPKWLVEFGSKFEIARKNLESLQLDFLAATYVFKNGEDILELNNGNTIKLSQASSGMQSVIPLLLVVKNFTLHPSELLTAFVLEEPELNLYPSAQKDLIEYVISAIKESKDHLTITTHSPYLLTALDNLIQANNAASARPEFKENVAKLVPENLWLSFDDISCYYFNNGVVISTLDHEMRSIGPSNIDDVSVELSETFERLLALKYSN